MPRPKSGPFRALQIAAVVIVMTRSAPAFTQSSPSDDRFHEGKALMDQGHVAEACAKFEESVALVRRGGALLNLAVCRETEGRNATALRLFEEARALALADGRADRVELADEKIKDVRSRLSWLTVELPPGVLPLELAIRCDGERMTEATWGAPTAVDPGPHTVVATAPGRVSFRAVTVVGDTGDRQTVQVPALAVDPSTLSATAPPQPDLSPPPPAWRKPLAWTAVGVGTAGAIAGGIFGVAALVESHASKSQCLSDDVCSEGGFERNRAAHTDASIANVAIPVGLVAFGAGLSLLLTSRSAASSSQKAAAAGKPHGAAGARVVFTGAVPSVAPNAASLGMQGVW